MLLIRTSKGYLSGGGTYTHRKAGAKRFYDVSVALDEARKCGVPNATVIAISSKPKRKTGIDIFPDETEEF